MTCWSLEIRLPLPNNQSRVQETLKDEGLVMIKRFSGLKITHDRPNHTLTFSQSSCTENVLGYFGIMNWNSLPTPMEVVYKQQQLIQNESEEASNLFVLTSDRLSYVPDDWNSHWYRIWNRKALPELRKSKTWALDGSKTIPSLRQMHPKHWNHRRNQEFARTPWILRFRL